MKARSFYYFSWEKSLYSLREKLVLVGNRTLGSIFKIYEALPRQMGRKKSAPQTTVALGDCSSRMWDFTFIIML